MGGAVRMLVLMCTVGHGGGPRLGAPVFLTAPSRGPAGY